MMKRIKNWWAQVTGVAQSRALDGGDILLEVYEAANREWRWRMKRAGKIVADSGEGYSTRSNAMRAGHRLVDGLQRRGVFQE